MSKAEKRKAADTLRIIVKAFVESFHKGSHAIAILSLVIVFVVTGISSSNINNKDKEIKKLIENINKWQQEIMDSTSKGSDIGLTSLFSTTRESLSDLYKLYFDPTTPPSLAKRYERMAVGFKIPILKKTFVAQFKNRNYNFEILSLFEAVDYSNKNINEKKIVKITARYDKSVDNPESNSTYFNLYIVPGMSLTELSSLIEKDIELEINGKKSVISKKDCEVNILGSKEAPSPLVVCRIPIKNLKNNDIIKLYIEFEKYNQKASASTTPIPFSLYDLHIERYAQGVKSAQVSLKFDQKMWIDTICFDMANIECIPCDENRIEITYPENYNINTSSYKYEFKLTNPKEPIAIAFYKYPN